MAYINAGGSNTKKIIAVSSGLTQLTTRSQLPKLQAHRVHKYLTRDVTGRKECYITGFTEQEAKQFITLKHNNIGLGFDQIKEISGTNALLSSHLTEMDSLDNYKQKVRREVEKFLLGNLHGNWRSQRHVCS